MKKTQKSQLNKLVGKTKSSRRNPLRYLLFFCLVFLGVNVAGVVIGSAWFQESSFQVARFAPGVFFTSPFFGNYLLFCITVSAGICGVYFAAPWQNRF